MTKPVSSDSFLTVLGQRVEILVKACKRRRDDSNVQIHDSAEPLVHFVEEVDKRIAGNSGKPDIVPDLSAGWQVGSSVGLL